MKIVICRPGKWVWRVNFDGGDVEEHVDFHKVKLASLGFNKFYEGDVD